MAVSGHPGRTEPLRVLRAAEQCGRAIAFVIVGRCPARAFLQRKPGSTFQCLHMAFSSHERTIAFSGGFRYRPTNIIKFLRKSLCRSTAWMKIPAPPAPALIDRISPRSKRTFLRQKVARNHLPMRTQQHLPPIQPSPLRHIPLRALVHDAIALDDRSSQRLRTLRMAKAVQNGEVAGEPRGPKARGSSITHKDPGFPWMNHR